jgi:hypothetical protein
MQKLELLVFFWFQAAIAEWLPMQYSMSIVDPKRDSFGIGFDFLDTFAYVDLMELTLGSKC